MQINGTSVRRMMSLAAFVAAVAGTSVANAQQGEDSVRGSFDQPLKAKGAQATSGTKSTMMMSESDGEHTYSVKIQGDKVTAELDGEQLPAKRVRQRDGRVEILDADGEVMKTFNTRVINQAQPFGAVAPRFRVEAIPGEQGQAFGGTTKMWTNEEPPKVMIGITMTDSEEGGAQIESVIDGLPADQAGLKVGDRVIKCNSKDLETVEDWRAMIREANPGDTMALTVDRDGKNVDLKLKLAKFDEKVMPKREPMPDMTKWYAMGDDGVQAARESIEKALESLKDTKKLEGKALDTVREALQNALAKLEEVKAHSALRMGDHNRVFGGQGQNFVFPAPPAVPGGNADMMRQLEKMNAQMEKLNRRLEELENNKR